MQLKPLSFAILSTFLPISTVMAAETTTLPKIKVVEPSDRMPAGTLSENAIKGSVSAHSDLVDILSQSPSVSVNQAGGTSGFPVIRGIADHRLDVQVDGMPLLASCPNHMNTPLSYISPSQTSSAEIYPSITPVSVGGDSIGGSILVETENPQFAPRGEHITEGEIGGYFRSNGEAKGGNVTVTTASDKLNLTYKGNYAQAENYKAADDFKDFTTTTNAAAGTEFTSGTEGSSTDEDEVAGTAYETMNHNLSLAYQGDDSLLTATVIKQSTPYQQYPNQRMDMTDNDSQKINLSWQNEMDWGELKIQAYRETVDHEMAFMDYKTSKQMPMASESDTNGLKFSTLIALNESSELNLGTEIQQYTLDDYWDPSPVSGTMMGPGTFWNINNGTRDRYALFAEWTNQLNQEWQTRLGARYERVNTDADKVQGYDDTSMMTKTDVSQFNSSDRSKTDHNLNLNVLANYQPSQTFDVDMGLARQVRSPDLYERYTWSNWPMAALMNNFAGDGNGYVGDIDLDPETAYTASANLDWHDANQTVWGLQVMPYVSYIQNYIDATLVQNYGDFSVLKYANQSARIHGVDIAGHHDLTENDYGQWRIHAKANYARGTNLDTNDDLHHIMPLNGSITLSQQLNGWNNAIELVMVGDKSNVSDVRNEQKTTAYTLLNFQGSYAWKAMRIDFGVENLFDTDYDLPTGGAYTGEGMTMSIKGVPLMNVPGPGRSFYAGLNVKF
jgi:iron complex outermembrane receptor protein